jgi:trk system potassium uptake protein TrkH
MRLATSLRVLGVLLMLFSATMLVPFAVSLWYEDGQSLVFFTAFSIVMVSGLLFWLPTYNDRQELRIRDGFLITSLFWLGLGIAGSVPFMLLSSGLDLSSSTLQLSSIDAIFESISGLTTTGATVITGLDLLPKSILYYRQQLQWLGGIGIVVIAVAILPMLGIGGMQLYRAETPGPIKDRKMTPRITGTAKALFAIYVLLTVVCALCFWVAGMSAFDAICHAFSTIAIGGFSTHDASIGYFDSPAIMLICSTFMIIAGINFALHFSAWQRYSLAQYGRDPETRFYLTVIFGASIVTCGYLAYSDTLSLHDSLLQGFFQTVSIATTTGFATADFSQWPTFLPVLLMLCSFVGGCAGSTGGGIKAVRVMLIFRQGFRELSQLVHPSAIIPLKIGSRRVPAKVVSAVWSFFAVYMASFACILLVLMATGMDYLTAFSATTASLNNLGPGLGDVAAHYGQTTTLAKAVMSLAMLLGRLEIFTLLVLFTPMFWRR